MEKRAKDRAWAKIFETYKLNQHKFNKSPVIITAEQIKEATKHFTTTTEREVRILCKQDTREDRPTIFQKKSLFILPIRNGIYSIVKGEGYVDIPDIKETTEVYVSKLDFDLETSKVGNSEMQHLDFAYASSLIRTFLNDESLVLTIRGRKYTPDTGFSFLVGKHTIEVRSVQTEVDAGFEGRNQVVLIEAKASGQTNTIIRQLYYPLRQWQFHTKKKVETVFFEKVGGSYKLWQFRFTNFENYNSIELVRAKKFEIKTS
jgi:hypothetical protein